MTYLITESSEEEDEDEAISGPPGLAPAGPQEDEEVSILSYANILMGISILSSTDWRPT
jgi:hypothetical protein